MLLIVSIGPIKIIANAARIVVTALLSQWVSGEAAQKFSHDFSGWVMIPFAAQLLLLMFRWLCRVMRELGLVDVGETAR